MEVLNYMHLYIYASSASAFLTSVTEEEGGGGGAFLFEICSVTI